MEKRSDWTLLYQDQLAQVWGRADKYDNPDSPHFLAARSISDHPVSGLAPWPAFPDRGGRNAFVQSARTYLAARDRQPAAPRTAPRTAHRAIAAEIFKACLALRSPVLPTFPVRF